MKDRQTYSVVKILLIKVIIIKRFSLQKLSPPGERVGILTQAKNLCQDMKSHDKKNNDLRFIIS